MNANTHGESPSRLSSKSWFRIGAVMRLGFLALMGAALSAASAQAQPFAYVTNSNSDNVSVIDTSTNTVITTISVGDNPQGVAVTLNGAFVYVANANSNNVSVIDTSTNTEVDVDGDAGNGITRIPVGAVPVGVAVTLNGAFVYVTNINGNNVSVIDTSTNAVTDTIPVGSGPLGVAVTPDGAFVYVANLSSDNVSVIDTSTNTVITTIPVGTTPEGIAVTPDGAFVYVTNALSDNVSVIDTSTNTVITTIPVGTTPEGIAVTPDSAFVYVANQASDDVSVIDTATNTEVDVDGIPGNGITRIPVGDVPLGTAVTPDGAFVYVANVNSNNVSVIDTATNAVTDTVAVGSAPVAFGKFIGPEACIGAGTFRIHGRVEKAISGAKMTLTGPDGCASTATTDSKGRYDFSTLAGGTYTVTPSKTGCTFKPASRTATVSQKRKTIEANFNGTCP